MSRLRMIAQGNPKRLVPYWGLVLSDKVFTWREPDVLVHLLDMMLSMVKGVKTIIEGTCTSPYAYQSTSSSARHYMIRMERFAFDILHFDPVGLQKEIEIKYRACKLAGMIYSQMTTFLREEQVSERMECFCRFLQVEDLTSCVEKTVCALMDSHGNFGLDSLQNILESDNQISRKVFSLRYKELIDCIPQYAAVDCAIAAAESLDNKSLLKILELVRDEDLIGCLSRCEDQTFGLMSIADRDKLYCRLVNSNHPIDDQFVGAFGKLAECCCSQIIDRILDCQSVTSKCKLQLILKYAKLNKLEYLEKVFELSSEDNLVLVCQILSYYKDSIAGFEHLYSLLSHPEPKVVWNAARALKGRSRLESNMKTFRSALENLIANQSNEKAKTAIAELLTTYGN